MPHDAAPLLRLPARQHTAHGCTHGPILLVARQLLHETPPLRLINHVVAQDVQQGRWGQQPNDELSLTLRLDAEAIPDLVIGVGRYRLPLEVGVLRRARRSVHGRRAAVGDAHQVVVEQLRRAASLPLRSRLLIAP